MFIINQFIIRLLNILFTELNKLEFFNLFHCIPLVHFYTVSFHVKENTIQGLLNTISNDTDECFHYEIHIFSRENISLFSEAPLLLWRRHPRLYIHRRVNALCPTASFTVRTLCFLHFDEWSLRTGQDKPKTQKISRVYFSRL